jgi:hypothetical protein
MTRLIWCSSPILVDLFLICADPRLIRAED